MKLTSITIRIADGVSKAVESTLPAVSHSNARKVLAYIANLCTEEAQYWQQEGDAKPKHKRKAAEMAALFLAFSDAFTLAEVALAGAGDGA